MFGSVYADPDGVIRRVGGLEDRGPEQRFQFFVIRRVGGLEGVAEDDAHQPAVIRRVGGLEV